MKKYIFAALFGAAVILNSAAALAQEERYVVILKETPPIMFFDESNGVINHVDNIFVVDSAKAAYSLAPADNVAAIFPDEVAYLMEYKDDTPETATFLADAPVVEPYPDGADDLYFADQWHMPYIKVSSAWSKGLDGRGVRVGVVDSGIDRYHPDLPLPKYYYSAISGSDPTDVQDNLGHGTAVTGLIAAKTNNGIYTSGIAHGVEIVSIKVANSNNVLTSNMLLGFKKALELDCDVINMSLGFTWETSPQTAASMRDIVQKAVNDGVIIVAAAGNDGALAEQGGYYQYPASYPDVVSVGSIGDYSNHTGVSMDFTKLSVPTRSSNGTYTYSTILSDAPSSFTQHNDRVTCAAPGYRVMSLNLNNTTSRKSGTSFASPIVASAAAIAKQINPNITAPEFIEALQKTSTDIFTEGYDNYTGYGALNMEELIPYLIGEETPTPIPTDTPEPTATPTPTPEPTPTPSPSPTPPPTPEPTSHVTKNGSNYVINAYYDELDTDARIFAAIYEDDKLTAVKSVMVAKGSTNTKIYLFNYGGEIDYAQIYIWSDKEGALSMLPLADKHIAKTAE